LVNSSDGVCSIEVAVITFVIKGDVEIDDIPVPQFTLVRNAVADGLVDRGADGFWKFPITKGRRVRIPINDSLMDNGINFICGDSRVHVGCGKVEYFAAEATGNAHGVDFIWSEDTRGVTQRAHFGNRNTVITQGIVRTWNVIGDLTPGRKWVDRSEGTRVDVIWEWVECAVWTCQVMNRFV